MGENVNVIWKERGWPLNSPFGGAEAEAEAEESISGRVISIDVSDSAKILESCGWTKLSSSGGEASSTRGQKLGILEIAAERRA